MGQRGSNCDIVFRHFADLEKILSFRERCELPDFFVNTAQICFIQIGSKITAQNKSLVIYEMKQINRFCQIR